LGSCEYFFVLPANIFCLLFLVTFFFADSERALDKGLSFGFLPSFLLFQLQLLFVVDAVFCFFLLDSCQPLESAQLLILLDLLLQLFSSRENLVSGDVELDHLRALGLLGSEAGLVVQLFEYLVFGFVGRSDLHLIPDSVGIPLNLGFPLGLLGFVVIPLPRDRIIVAFHELLVDSSLLLDLGLEDVKPLLVCSIFEWVVVLDDSWILVGADIATVVERLHMRMHRDLAPSPSLTLVI